MTHTAAAVAAHELGEWLTVAEAARRLTLSEARVRQLADAGRVAQVKLPNGRLLSPAGVEALAACRAARRHAREVDRGR